jgi:hypothetical protein
MRRRFLETTNASFMFLGTTAELDEDGDDADAPNFPPSLEAFFEPLLDNSSARR